MPVGEFDLWVFHQVTQVCQVMVKNGLNTSFQADMTWQKSAKSDPSHAKSLPSQSDWQPFLVTYGRWLSPCRSVMLQACSLACQVSSWTGDCQQHVVPVVITNGTFNFQLVNIWLQLVTTGQVLTSSINPINTGFHHPDWSKLVSWSGSGSNFISLVNNLVKNNQKREY